MARIRTTHTGSLPRPHDLALMLLADDRGEGVPGLDDRVRSSVFEVVERQRDLGIDLVNDGEMGKVGFAMYVKDRLTGFDGESKWLGKRRPEMEDHPDFAERWKANTDQTVLTTPACTGEIRVKDASGVVRDIANLKAAASAAGLPPERLFMTAAS